MIVQESLSFHSQPRLLPVSVRINLTAVLGRGGGVLIIPVFWVKKQTLSEVTY